MKRFVIFIFLFCLSVLATNYFVDYESGDDNNNGTSSSTPFQYCPDDDSATGISNSTSLSAGDTVFFKKGVRHHASLEPLTSGEKTNYIVYKGNSSWGTGDRAIIDGSLPIDDGTWAYYGVVGSDSIFKASIGTNTLLTRAKLFWDDDTVLMQAQTPDQDNVYNPWVATDKYYHQDTGGLGWFRDTSLFTVLGYDSADLLGSGLYMWRYSVIYDRTYYIRACVPATYTCSLSANQATIDWSPSAGVPVQGYALCKKLPFLNNKLEYCLDTTGNPDTIYMISVDGKKPTEIRKAYRLTGVDFAQNNVNYIEINGFEIIGHNDVNTHSYGAIFCDYASAGRTGYRIINCLIHDGAGSAVHLKTLNDIYVDSCYFYHNGIAITSECEYGMHVVDCDTVVIKNTHIRNENYDGIYLQSSGSNISLDNIIIHDCWSERTHADGLKIEGVAGDTFSTVTVNRMRIWDCEQCFFSTGWYGGTFMNSVIGPCSPVAECFRLTTHDGTGCKNINILNNTFIGWKTGNGLQLDDDDATYINVYNNILTNFTWGSGDNIEHEDNIYLETPDSLGVGCFVSTDTSDLFQSYNDTNFTITATSPAIDVGMDLTEYSVIVDYTGLSRPRGGGL